MRRKSNEDDVMLMTKLHHFEGLVRSIRLRIEHSTIPLQDGLTIAVPTLGALKMPTGCLVDGQRMSGSKTLPVGRDAFESCYLNAVDFSSFHIFPVNLGDDILSRSRDIVSCRCLIHIVDIFL